MDIYYITLDLQKIEKNGKGAVDHEGPKEDTDGKKIFIGVEIVPEQGIEMQIAEKGYRKYDQNRKLNDFK